MVKQAIATLVVALLVVFASPIWAEKSSVLKKLTYGAVTKEECTKKYVCLARVNPDTYARLSRKMGFERFAAVNELPPGAKPEDPVKLFRMYAVKEKNTGAS